MRNDAGFSLLEVVIALGLAGVALAGSLGLLLVQRHASSTNETALAVKGCQEMMERLRAMSPVQVRAQDGVRFVVRRLHPSREVGRIAVTEPEPDARLEVRVSVETGELGVRPVRAELVSWRSVR